MGEGEREETERKGVPWRSTQQVVYWTNLNLSLQSIGGSFLLSDWRRSSEEYRISYWQPVPREVVLRQSLPRDKAFSQLLADSCTWRMCTPSAPPPPHASDNQHWDKTKTILASHKSLEQDTTTSVSDSVSSHITKKFQKNPLFFVLPK